MRPATLAFAAVLALVPLAASTSAADEPVLNLYSSRHYDTDERLYSEFTKRTGIKINRIEDNANVLIARIKAEGRNSPADVLLTTDAGRLWAAQQAGLLQKVDSEVLGTRIPAHFRHPEGLWFGFSKRARVIFYDKDRVKPEQVQTYSDLADPGLAGLVCTRSSSNIYMLSLMAAQIHHQGADKAKAWARGMWENRARDPQGGDTDQLRSIVSGECGVALANTYYFARALRRDVRGLKHPEETSQIGVVFPNQKSTGAHVNISGGGVLKHAPHKENAVKFLEYLVSDSAQKYFSAGNDEYPVVENVPVSPNVEQLGEFKEDKIDLTILGKNQTAAQSLYDSVGYK